MVFFRMEYSSTLKNGRMNIMSLGSERYMSMDTTHLTSQTDGVFKVMFNRTLPIFYGPLIIVLIAIYFVL